MEDLQQWKTCVNRVAVKSLVAEIVDVVRQWTSCSIGDPTTFGVQRHCSCPALEVQQQCRSCDSGGAETLDVLNQWRCWYGEGDGTVVVLCQLRSCDIGVPAIVEVLRQWR